MHRGKDQSGEKTVSLFL